MEKLKPSAAGRTQVVHDLLFEPVYDDEGNITGHVERDPPLVTNAQARELLGFPAETENTK